MRRPYNFLSFLCFSDNPSYVRRLKESAAPVIIIGQDEGADKGGQEKTVPRPYPRRIKSERVEVGGCGVWAEYILNEW